MKTFKWLLSITCLIAINKVQAQNIPSKQYLGTVTYTKQAKITDKATFNKTSSIFIKTIADSLMKQMMALKTKLKEDTSEISATTEPFKDLMRQEVFKMGAQETLIDDLQKDRIVNFIIENGSDKRERFNFNYTDSLVYNSYNSEEIEDYFDNETIISLKEFKSERKLIKGYNCFKVIYVYQENFDKEEFRMPEMIIERELWVTDKIIVPFHSIIRNQSILSKYYPIEITEKIHNVNGYETKYTIDSISIN